MTTAKNRRVHNSLHANILDDPAVATQSVNNIVLSVEEQVFMMTSRKLSHGFREDTRFPDVWVKGDDTTVLVQDMTTEHMCMTIGLWLRKEFESRESESLGFSPPNEEAIQYVSAYDSPEVWLTDSNALLTTPALRTMLTRLEGIDGGMVYLHDILKTRAEESLTTSQSVPEHWVFTIPAFF